MACEEALLTLSVSKQCRGIFFMCHLSANENSEFHYFEYGAFDSFFENVSRYQLKKNFVEVNGNCISTKNDVQIEEERRKNKKWSVNGNNRHNNNFALYNKLNTKKILLL